jgi:hypothetical protein
MAVGDYVQCNACGGTYQPILADGSEYYHACPSQRAIDDGPDPADVTGKTRKVKLVAIDNRRNENIAGVDDKGKAIIKSEGLGVTVITDVSKLPPTLTTGG